MELWRNCEILFGRAEFLEAPTSKKIGLAALVPPD
jgi:hypothetical protein